MMPMPTYVFGKKILRQVSAARPYLDDFFGVVFVAALVFAVLAAVAEAFVPGFVVNYISPRFVVLILALSGALKIAFTEAGEVRPISLAYRIVLTFLGAAAAVGTGFAAWYYFGDIDGRSGLTVAAVATSIAVFWNALRRPEDVEE
jgi:hypothetical protein